MKKFIAMFMCAALMACVSVSAQDIYKTAANVPMVQLNNGVLMPQFGLGTFMQPSDAICKQSCLTALKAGYSCENAFRAAEEEMIVFYGKHSEIVHGLNRIVGGLDSNVPLEELLRGFASESRSEEIRDFAEIFAIARKSGGNMTDILQRTISQIQNRMDVEREIRVLMSSKKLEQTIMDVVPFGIIAYIGITSRGFFDVLYHNTAGILIMTACLLAYLGAFVLSEKIAAIKV